MDRKQLRTVLYRLVNTDDGKQLLNFLKNDYLLRSSVKESVEKTYYELGRKELVTELISLLEKKDLSFDNKE